MTDTRESLAEQLAKKIKPGITINAKDGTTEVSDGGVFAANLPDGITVEQVEALSAYEASFVAGLTQAFGEASVDACAAAADLQRTSISYPMIGKDRIKASFDRDVSKPGPVGENGEKTTIVTHADVTVSIDHYAGRYAGDLRAAKLGVKDYWAKTMKKD